MGDKVSREVYTVKRFLLLGVFFFLLAAGFCRAEAPEPKALTVMVYMCGSNLETLDGSASADIGEMLQSNFDADRVNLAVMMGGSRRWDRDLKSGEAGVVEFFRKKGELKKRVVRPEADVNMGDPGTLSGFIRDSLERYPARQYALILWDHGGGPMEGVCMDELNAPDRLSISELARALDDARLPDKLSWIGFDACLMSSVEVASKMAPYARYMVASQEREPGSGWNYAFLEGIEGDGDGAATGARIIDAYLSYAPQSRTDLTMACIDLSGVPDIEASLDAMYRGMASGLASGTFSRISNLRFSARSFGRGLEDSAASAGYDMVDVASLCDSYAPENEEGARRVREAVERAVIAHGENLEDCCGISVYHPFRNQRQYLSAWRKRYETLDFCPGYRDFIEAYGDIMAGAHLVRWSDLTDIQVSDGASTVTLKLSDEQARNLASARLVVMARNLFDEADDAYFRVFSTADVSVNDGLLVAEYSGEAMQILDDAGIVPLTGAVSYSVTEDGRYLLKLYPIDADGTRWQRPVIASYEMDAAGGLVFKGFSVYDELSGDYSSRGELDLSRLMGFTLMNDYRKPTANGSGEWLAFDQWEEDSHADMRLIASYDVLRTAISPGFELDLLRQEDLYAAYEVTDTQGNVYMSALTPLKGGTVQYYPSEIALGDACPIVAADMTTYWDERCILVSLYVKNQSDMERYYEVFDLRADGREAKPLGGSLEGGTGSPYRQGKVAKLRPGEDGWINLYLFENSFEGRSADDVLKALDGTLWIGSDEPGEPNYWARFALQADQPLDVIFHGDGDEATPQRAGEWLPVRMIGMEQDAYRFGSSVISQWAGEEGLSRIIVNMVVENIGEADMAFYIDDVRVNGIPVGVTAMNAMGSGGKNAANRFSVATGERSAAGIVLDYPAISAILPDVSLRTLSFRLSMSAVEDGVNSWQSSLPVDLITEVPLDGFYEDASALPSKDLLMAGIDLGAFDESTARTLFSDGGREVLLQGAFISGRSFILLLRFENNTDQAQKITLGRATMDGSAATIGGTESAYLRVRNARVRSRHLDKALWTGERGVTVTLEPGETLYRYVTLEPREDDRAEVSELAFQAYMYPVDSPLDGVWLDAVRVSTEEPGPLLEGFEAIAPASDYAIVPGTPVADNPAVPLFEPELVTPGEDPSRCAIPLEYRLPEGERMELGYYTLLRRVRSDAALAGLNIINNAQGQAGESTISFAGDREWLLYYGSGALRVEEDGAVARATLPGVCPAVFAGGESLPLIDTVFQEEEGRFMLNWHGNSAVFHALDFPDAVLPSGFNAVFIGWDPETGRASLEDFHAIGRQDMDALRQLVSEGVRLIPADADAEQIVAMLQGTGGVKQYMLLRLDRPQMRLGLEALGDVDDYCVVFYYKTRDGVTRCTTPAGLADCVASSGGR